MSLSPDQMNIIVLDEVRELCRAARDYELGGAELYTSREHRRIAEWVLVGKKEIAEEILAMIGE
jgi:hypothetical protein